MFDNQAYRYDYAPDPIDEFIAQLLSEVPDILPESVNTLSSLSPSAPAIASVPVAISAPPFPPSFVAGVTTATIPDTASQYLTCQWASAHTPDRVCGAPLLRDPKHACMHLRQAHHVRGNEKVTVQCHWYDCTVAPMQRGSLIRHVLTVHLGLLRWRCELCRRTFSRRGTSHTCVDGA